MDSCSFPDIAAEFDTMVATVAPEQHLDPVCSTSSWMVPVADAFAADAHRRVFRSDNGFIAFLEHSTINGPVWTGFDSVWGFATPLVGPDPVAIVDDLTGVMATHEFFLWSISGLDPLGPLFDEIQRLSPAGYTDTADRCIVDLSGGFEAWLDRRSSRFRRSLRAAANRGEAAGVEIEHVRPSTAGETYVAFDRILDIERQSWKTDAGSGLHGTQLGVFTLDMCRRHATEGRLRVQFAMLDGVDVGYVVGARIGDRYRGFQHSFSSDHPQLSIGKLLQFHTIRAMATEGIATYDMGMHMGYKESYADRIESTVTAVIAGKG